MKNTQPKEKIKVEKDFFLKLAKQVTDIDRRVKNLELVKKADEEINLLAPKEPNMTRILGRPEIDIEINFLENYPMAQIKDQGILFQTELEQLLKRYNVQSVHLNYRRKIR